VRVHYVLRDQKEEIGDRYLSVDANTRVYPKVSGLSRLRNTRIRLQQQTIVEKQHKELWRQNSLD